MSLSHFPDPDMHDYRDARLQEDVWVVPDSVIEAYELDDAAISDLDTGSSSISGWNGQGSYLMSGGATGQTHPVILATKPRFSYICGRADSILRLK